MALHLAQVGLHRVEAGDGAGALRGDRRLFDLDVFDPFRIWLRHRESSIALRRVLRPLALAFFFAVSLPRGGGGLVVARPFGLDVLLCRAALGDARLFRRYGGRALRRLRALRRSRHS